MCVEIYSNACMRDSVQHVAGTPEARVVFHSAGVNY